MKALSLIQPFASLIAIGAKTIETRTWKTNYRGVIAIQASSTKIWRHTYDLCMQEPFYSTLLKAKLITQESPIHPPIPELPTGAIVAVALLVHCERIHTNGSHDQFPYIDPLPPREPELSFGDYSEGRYAWKFINVQRLENPIPIRGMLGLWKMDNDLIARVTTEADRSYKHQNELEALRSGL